MATLALGAAGASGGPVGQAVGAAIGSYIDNTYIYPALFPQDPIEGPKISDLQLASTDEGSPMLRCFGAENRIPGTVIWTSGLKETKKTEEVGGKGGGPGVEQNTYTYSVDVAVAFTEGPVDGLGIVEFTRVWANTKVIYKENPEVNVSDNTLTSTAEIIYGMSIVNGSFTQVEIHRELTIKSPNGGPDLSLFRSGFDIVVAGWTVSANNGTFRGVAAWKNSGTGETFVKVSDETALFADDSNGGASTITRSRPHKLAWNLTGSCIT